MPSMFGSTIVYYNNSLYLAAGNTNLDLSTYQGKLFKFDINSEEWFELSSSNSYTPRIYSHSCIYEDYFYLFYGYDFLNFKTLETISRVNLNDQNLTWSDLSLDFDSTRYRFALTQNNDQVFIFGGSKSEKSSSSNQLMSLNLITLDSSLLSDWFQLPSPRQFHSMQLVSGQFFVFGGKDGETYYNDVWKFNPKSERWSPISALGAIPSSRYACASASEGDAFAIWGGEDKVGLKNDLYNFNALTYTWEILEPTTPSVPNPAKGACLVISIPKIYIFGGKTSSGFSSELWMYDLWTNAYKLLSTDIYSSAYCTCSLYKSEFYVIFGSNQNSSPQSLIRKYNITSGVWTNYFSKDDTGFSSIQGVQVFQEGSILKLGGQKWDMHIDQRIMVFNFDKADIMHLKNIDEYIYRAAYVYYNYSIYVFGGGEAVGSNLLMGYSNNRLLKYSMDEIINATNYTVLCSAGTYNTSKTCLLCPLGHYSENIDNKTCAACPEGTYNGRTGATSPRQCYPCAEGYYNSLKGQGYCLECPAVYTCPPGSIKPFESLATSSDKFVQPSIYNEPSTTTETFNFQISFGIICGIVLIICLLFYKTSILVAKLDLYNQFHNFVLDQYMYIKTNKFGGFCSGVFVILACIVIGNSIIAYQYANILETKSLIPKVVLDNEVSDYAAKSFFVEVKLLRYGDNCLKEFLNVSLSNAQGDQVKWTSEKDTSGSCIIQVFCDNCVFSIGSVLSVNSTEKQCYSSGIKVNVTSSSSIPKEISSAVTKLSPSGNHVFIGSIPSELFFTLVPSLFKSESDKWPSKLTGYHISSDVSPVAGSELMSHELSTASLFKLNINLKLSTSGLYTYRAIRQSPIVVISSLIGSVFGIMKAIGIGMKASEKYVKKTRDYRRNKEKNREISGNRQDFGKIFEVSYAAGDNTTKSGNND